MTEYHDKEKNLIILVSSIYIGGSIPAYFIYNIDISLASLKIFYGINIEDTYISPNLFNHFIPNENDLIIIYTMKAGNKTNLILTRFNLTYSNSLHVRYKFREISLSNYLREDICSNPKYIQSIFVNSFINYNDKDKQTIKEKENENYYKYQRDIVTLMACEKDDKVFYESKKIIMPQCLNILDEINNKSFHVIEFTQNKNKTVFDIYGDPKFVSLRNYSMQFYPGETEGNVVINYLKKVS